MHLVIPTRPSLFWLVCHPNRTFPPKEFEWESQNRLSPSPHRQTISFLTSNPWPTTLVLAGYKLVVLEPCACSTSMCVHGLSTVHAFATTWRLVCTFYCSFLTFYGVNESLSLRSLCLTSFLGWALLNCGLFLFNSFFTLFTSLLAFLPCHSVIPAILIIWLMLARPFLGLLYIFLWLILVAQYYHRASIHAVLGFLGPFHPFGHPQPISFPWASLVYSNSSFLGLLLSILGFFDPNYHILYFWGLWAFPPTPYLLNSLFWASLAHSCLLSISHNAYGLTTSNSRLL